MAALPKPTHEKSRPGEGRLNSKSLVGDGTNDIRQTDLRQAEAKAAADLIDGDLVLVVTTNIDGHHRRRPYLSLAAAQRAAERAVAAGHNAVVVLCELVPVSAVSASSRAVADSSDRWSA